MIDILRIFSNGANHNERDRTTKIVARGEMGCRAYTSFNLRNLLDVCHASLLRAVRATSSHVGRRSGTRSTGTNTLQVSESSNSVLQ